VTPEFIAGGPYNLTYAAERTHSLYLDSNYTFIDPAAVQREIKASDTTGQYQRLEPRDCIQNYAHVFLSDRRNLVIVSNTTSDQENNTLLGIETYITEYSIGNGIYSPFDW
jgi:hypothetical protein